MDWNDVRYFLALARSGSVRAAGAALGVSHSTVARRVEALEARLAARLFDRSRGGYALTEAGRQVLPRAEHIEGEVAALERGLVGQDERLAGSVVLTCCDTYVSNLLIAGLATFCERYPEIELTLTTDTRPFDLAKREADIAVRILAAGDSPADYLIGLKLAPLVVANYVGVDHADKLDPERAGSRPRWLSFEDRKLQEQMIAHSSYRDVPPWGAFASLEALAQGARAGLGLAMLPTYAGDAEPGLRRLAQPDLRHVADLWMLSHPDLRDNARLQAARAEVAAAVRRHSALFEGSGGAWT